ncbi:MAG: hypothetical protein AB8B57_01380 [Congregibacter sp.]
MFIDDKGEADSRVSTRTALRHVLVFQLKLAADALRDFLLSPLSIIAFGLDAMRKPPVEKSLYLRLMLLGRRSDRMINLFDDQHDSGEFTIDRAVDHLEDFLRPQGSVHDSMADDAGSNDFESPEGPESRDRQASFSKKRSEKSSEKRPEKKSDKKPEKNAH